MPESVRLGKTCFMREAKWRDTKRLLHVPDNQLQSAEIYSQPPLPLLLTTFFLIPFFIFFLPISNDQTGKY